MRLYETFSPVEHEILNEVYVDSSWIEDIDVAPDGKNVIMTLLSGRTYRLSNVPQKLFDLWIDAGSPGKFWHTYIAGKYNTRRIA